MSTRTDWWKRPPQTARAAALTALAVGLAVFAVQAAVRGGELLFAAAVAAPIAVLSFALNLRQVRTGRARAAEPGAD